MLTAILVALLTIQSAQAQQRNDTRAWYQAYADAQRQIQQKNWAAAVRDIDTALQRGAPRPGRRVHFYGDVYRDFNPDYYLGVAYLNLGRYAEADRAFERVRRAGLIGPRDPLYAEFSRQSTMVSRTLAQQAPATVPDLSGRTEQEARELLVKARLSVGQITKVEAKSKPGTVLKQDRTPGSQVALGTPVALVLAVPMQTVPDTTGRAGAQTPTKTPPPPAPPVPSNTPQPPPAKAGPKAPSQPEPSPPPPTRAQGQQGQQSPAPASLPAFPWPPPQYSAYSPIAREWVALGVNPTLASAARQLETAFDAAGYGERSYYWIPGGFALVSRIEQIQPDAAPVASPARWAVSTPMMKTGVIDYIRALFNAPPGFYRVIVFVVTDQDFAAGSRAPTSSEARNWIVTGSLRLPEAISKLPYSERHYTTALIYEFERRADQSDARVRTPSNSPGRVHLEKAGLWQALSRR